MPIIKPEIPVFPQILDTVPEWITSAGSLGNVREDDPGSFQLEATDPFGGNIIYSIQSGTLPGGFSLNNSTGLIDGTANSVNADETANFTIRATSDITGVYNDRQFSITVLNNNPPVWQTSNDGFLDVVEEGDTILIILEATDPENDLPVTYSIVSGELPDGLSFNTSTGEISGVVTELIGDVYAFTVRATDSRGDFSDRTFEIEVTSDITNIWMAWTGTEVLHLFSTPTTALIEVDDSISESVWMDWTGTDTIQLLTLPTTALIEVDDSISESVWMDWTGTEVLHLFSTPTTAEVEVSDTAEAQAWNDWDGSVVSSYDLALPTSAEMNVSDTITHSPWMSWAGPSTDGFFNDVVLLLKFDGTIGQSTFVDLSDFNKSVTNFNNAEIVDAESKFGDTSLYLDGSQALYTPIDADLNFDGGVDFTVEFWAYPISGRPVATLGDYNDTPGTFWFFDLDTSFNNPNAFRYGPSGSTGFSNQIAFTPSFNTWAHYAITRESDTIRAFVDGQLIGSTTLTDAPPSGRFFIGSGDSTSTNDPNFFSEAYIQEVRITRNVARYTSSFTPPSESFPVE